jgi:hypothetical protein
VGGKRGVEELLENLTIFPSTREPISITFHQSLSYPHIFLPPYLDQIDNHSCWCTCQLGRVGLKRWVVRPVRNSLSERIVGDRFLEGAKLQLQCSETSGPACC